MRYLFLLMMTITMGISVSAQLASKEISLGGTIGFESTKNKIDDPFGTKSSYKIFSIGPVVSIGLGNNWVVGAGARYARGKQSSENQSTSQTITSSITEFSLFARRFHSFNSQFGIFVQVLPTAGFGKQTRSSNQSNPFKTDLDFYSLSLNPGLYFKPSKKFILEAVFGEIIYTHSISTPETGFKSYSDIFDINLTEAVSIGIKYIL